MQKFSLLKRRPVRHRAEYDRLYLTRDQQLSCFCLLYTSDAADERSSVDIGGRRIIKKKKKKNSKLGEGLLKKIYIHERCT